MEEKYLLYLYYPSLSWFIPGIPILDTAKTRQQAQNGVTHARPKLKLGLTTLGSPRNGTLNLSVRNHLVSTSGVICLTDPCQPLKESNSALTSGFSA